MAVVDALTDLVTRARARGALFARTEAGAPWGIRLVDTTPLSVHVALAGEIWVRVPGAPPARMLPGDVCLVRGEDGYALSSEPDTPTITLQEAERRWPAAGRRAVIPGAGERCEFLCGAYRFDGGLCDGLLAALPPLIHLRAGSLAAADSLRGAVGLLASELDRAGPGGQAVLDRLLDLILVLSLREWVRTPGVELPPWLAALDDPLVGRALSLMHASPEHPWTVADLASSVSASRAAFARRFSAALGEGPLAYLTAWRMRLARELLRDTREPLSAVAARVGYGSEFAFSTAFSRTQGLSPTAFRRSVSDGVDTPATARAAPTPAGSGSGPRRRAARSAAG